MKRVTFSSKEIFNEADKVWESNRSSEPLAVKPMAAVVSNTSSSEVAAVQKSSKNKKNKNQNGGQNNQNKG